QLYDVPSGALSRWGVLINRRLKAFICVACQAIVLPSALAQHTTRQHKDARVSVDPNQLASIVENEGILDMLPAIDSMPVEFAGLKTEEGFGCPSCSVVCGSLQSLANHARFDHLQSLSEKDPSIRHVHIQRLGRGVSFKAPFEVRLRAMELQSSQADYIQALHQELNTRPSLPSSEVDHRHV
ncbi:hypothetical protein BV20DRAFT_916905, partial [Pilatotrama ljubarskyi]